ncbi:MAG TPA: universal stress protein [Gammaproteobacteria bacterium]
MYHSILVPIDGSAQSRKALEVAVDLIDSDRGLLYALNVQEPPLAEDTLGRATGAPARNADRVVQSSGQVVLDSVRAEAGLDAERVQTLVRAGRPASVIVSEAERLGVDAIVIGSRGTSDIGSLIMGSVSHRVLHSAPCSVIVVADRTP